MRDAIEILDLLLKQKGAAIDEKNNVLLNYLEIKRIIFRHVEGKDSSSLSRARGKQICYSLPHQSGSES